MPPNFLLTGKKEVLRGFRNPLLSYTLSFKVDNRTCIINLHKNDVDEWKKEHEKLEGENRALHIYFNSRGLAIPGNNTTEVSVKKEG